MIRRVLGSLQFLTVLPIHGATASPGQSAIFFPLAGALLGASAGGIFMLAATGLGRSLAGLISLAWLLGITGCLHEDGLADVADAVRAGRTPERIMTILKDSRIGTYGALALIVTVMLRWQALAQGSLKPVTEMAAALALSRASLVILAGIAPPVGTGLGRDFADSCTPGVVGLSAGCAVAVSLLVDWRYAAAMVLSTALVILLARAYFVRRLGGVNGDCLGATCQVVETANLVILAWHPYI